MLAYIHKLLETPIDSWGLIFLGTSLALLICVLLLLTKSKKDTSAEDLNRVLLDLSNDNQLKIQNALGNQGSQLRMELDAKLSHLSQDQQQQFLGFAKLIQNMSQQSTTLQTQNRQEANQQLSLMTQNIAKELSDIRSTLNNQLQLLQVNNDKKLEQMRTTVEEKLQSTLETRLSESFMQVSNQFKQVESGLGEMRALAGQVGELKRVLTNVKTRVSSRGT